MGHHSFQKLQSPLNIFVLHALGNDPSRARKTSLDHAFCFKRYAPQHCYYYHDINEPVADALRDIRFHVVIFDTTALCIRYYRPRNLFLAEKERYAFISDWDAVKIAFPQDDYDHSELLDTWLDEYRFDIVYSVVWDHRDLLYPRMSARGTILPALTGYVNDLDTSRMSVLRTPLSQRPIDIGYRAKFLPAQFGSYGQVKGLLAERMARAVRGLSLVTDISVNLDQVFVGEDWLRFLADCKYCLGSESGSSLRDPKGEITDCVASYVSQHPRASFSEIEAACFPGKDRQVIFTAVSPRLFEAAMMRTAQILIKAPYLGVLQPWQDYLPLDETCENAPEVISRLQDLAAAEQMAESCYAKLIGTHRFRYSTHVNEVLSRAADLVAKKHVKGTRAAEFNRLVKRQQKVVSQNSGQRAQGLARRLGIPSFLARFFRFSFRQ